MKKHKKKKNLQSSKPEDRHTEKYGKYFIYINPSPSPEQLGTRGVPLRGISSHWEKENRGTPASLTALYIGSLCSQGLPSLHQS